MAIWSVSVDSEINIGHYIANLVDLGSNRSLHRVPNAIPKYVTPLPSGVRNIFKIIRVTLINHPENCLLENFGHFTCVRKAIKIVPITQLAEQPYSFTTIEPRT